MKRWWVGQRIKVRPKFPIGNATVYKGMIMAIDWHMRMARVEVYIGLSCMDHWFTFEDLERMQEEPNE